MKSILKGMLVALIVAACLLLVLPLQTFLAYAGDFEISWLALLPRLVVGLMVCWIALAAALAIKSSFVSVVLLAIVTGTILESGFLSIGLPELNGNLTGYRVVSRMIWDGAVWLAVLVAFLVFRKGVAKYRMVIALALLLYACAAFFDVRKPPVPVVAEDSLCVPKIMMRSEVVQSVRYSPTDNVIVLILDSISAEAAHDIFAGDPLLRDGFPGFVNYTQNVGMHWCTATAIPSMMTGRYLSNGRALVNCYANRFAADSAIANYLTRDIPTFVNFFECKETEGYTNRSFFSDDAMRSVKDPPKASEDGRMQGLYPFTVCELTLFRCIPYAFKGRYLDWFARREAEQTANEPVVPKNGVADRGQSKSPTVIKDLQDDDRLWPILWSRPVEAGFKRTLQIHHARGGHPPLKFDADGHRISVPSPTYGDYLATCKFSFRQVRRLFDVWRTNGVYDASSIVLLADHACHLTSSAATGMKRSLSFAFPFLMVKPKGASAAFCESPTPTTHAHVADLLRALRDRSLSREEIEKILTDKQRLFRIIRKGKIEDYVFDEAGNCKPEVRNDDNEPDRAGLKAVTNGCEYSFSYARAKSYPDFVLSNGLRWDVQAGILHERNPMTLTFKHAKPQTAVRAKIKARIRVPRGKKVATVSINGETHTFQKEVGEYEIAISRVNVDGDGYLTLSIECDEPKGFYDFQLYSIAFEDTK